MESDKIVAKNGTANHQVVKANGHHNGQVPASPVTPFQPPDGGIRAWTILVSAFLCNGVLFGIINTYGVIYLKLQKQLEEAGVEEASGKAALVGSLTIGSTFFLSPVSGILVDRIGLRQTTIIGGILCAGGMLISSFFTTNVNVLYFTYGIMFGFGAALAYTPTLAILGHYFKNYLGVASGIVTAGSSVFTFGLPKILDHLIHSYGLPSTIRFIALMACFIIACGVLYKPLQPPAPRPAKKATRSKAHNLARSLINFDNWKKKRYVIWACSIPVALFGYFVPYVHMNKFVEVHFKGGDHNMPVMMIGVSSCLGRLLFGYIADFPRINRIVLQQVAFVMIGLTTMLLPATSSFSLLCIFAFSMGLFDGCFISLLGPIAYDLCGQHGATQAIGFLLGICSFPLTLGPFVAGLLFDHMGSYTLAFVLAGIPPLVGAACMICILYVKDENRSSIATEITQQSVKQNGWADPENLAETKLFIPKTPPTMELAKEGSEPKRILASAESLNDAIDEHKA